MKKLLLVIIPITVLCFCMALGGVTVAVADSTVTSTQDFLSELVQANESNTTESVLIEKFVSLFGTENVFIQDFSFSSENYTTPQLGRNIIAKMESATATDGGQIVIGAHYDTIANSQGANDNASGVTALYLIAEQLSKVDIPFDVVFVAFDCEEDGMIGSQNFVNELAKYSFSTAENTLLMINLDSIANGDNLYVGCECVATDLAQLFVDCSNGTLQEKPHAIGTTIAVQTELDYGYYEMVNNTDHTPFRLAGIPTANIFSGNFDVVWWDYVERKDGQNLSINSTNDTLDNLQQNGVYLDNINNVVSCVVSTVTNGQFVSVVGNARSQLVNLKGWFDPLWPRIAVIVLLVVLIIVGVIYYKKLQKNALLGNAEVKNARVFTTPDAKDIFTFED